MPSAVGRLAWDPMPKTLTGAELQLDDGPARDAELFLVDGNNLAYRAFFALPEELATTEGFPTNALLGFTNMLFKLLSDYRPKGVAVAWDTRPVHRRDRRGAEVYKAGRRPMPDLLREQFPYFRPIVEAFGYRNLEFEGWEADDVIATLATRADEAGIRTVVVSTDRDAFQLVTDNVALMMTPRGVADVNVYTPERVEARYGIVRTRSRTSSASRATRSDNIPGVPGIGDKTAGQLIAQYGSLEEVIEHADELSPGAAQEHHGARRPGAPVEGARDDAARPRARLRPGRARARAAGPLGAAGDVPPLRVPQPARPRRQAGRGRPGASRCASTGPRWSGARASCRRCAAASSLAIRDGRFALAQDDGVLVGPWRDELVAAAPRRRDRRPRLQGAAAADDGAGRGHDAARVPDRARPRRRTSSTTSPRSTASSRSRRRRRRRRPRRSSATPRSRAGSRR